MMVRWSGERLVNVISFDHDIGGRETCSFLEFIFYCIFCDFLFYPKNVFKASIKCTNLLHGTIGNR